MRINEILDSSNSWAGLHNISLSLFDSFKIEYEKINRVALEVKNLQSKSDNELWRETIYRTLVDRAYRFTEDVNNYLQSIDTLNLRQADEDLNSQYIELSNLTAQINKLIDLF